MRNELKCVIFDMDGLLVDTEMFRFQAYKKAFHEFKISFSKLDYIKYWVIEGKGLYSYLNEKNLNLDFLKLKELKEIYFLHIINNNKIKCYKGAVKLLNELKNKNIKLAIATSSSKSETKTILKNVKINNYFDIIATKDDVTEKKPNTEIYNYILHTLDLDTKNCISIEDSDKGIIPSMKLHIKTILVPNEYTKNRISSTYDLKVNSLEKLNFKKLQAILQI